MPSSSCDERTAPALAVIYKGGGSPMSTTPRCGQHRLSQQRPTRAWAPLSPPRRQAPPHCPVARPSRSPPLRARTLTPHSPPGGALTSAETSAGASESCYVTYSSRHGPVITPPSHTESSRCTDIFLLYFVYLLVYKLICIYSVICKFHFLFSIHDTFPRLHYQRLRSNKGGNTCTVSADIRLLQRGKISVQSINYLFK
jgi:hypothetical protein